LDVSAELVSHQGNVVEVGRLAGALEKRWGVAGGRGGEGGKWDSQGGGK